ncbi:MAG: ATP-dependent zinc protease [Helicobacteraceae bacterium]|nr:ATP-dependent zinc protease [Candidatus Sulfurimonas ponti]MBL6974035.1 ATP-dependent zinc protease [Sulfurimonas sp.]
MIEKKIIGKKEIISILDLELYDLDAKVDTGADSNALHCDHIFVDGDDVVHFTLLDEVHEAYHGKKMQVPLYEMRKIRSSNGSLQDRPSIQVEVEFFGKKYDTVISLTSRADMKYPMLIGRKFIANKFLVDVSQEYLSKKK